MSRITRLRRTEPSVGYYVSYSIFVLVVLWMSIASAVFEYRNPLSNKMAFFRDFKEVMTFQKMAKYQFETYRK